MSGERKFKVSCAADKTSSSWEPRERSWKQIVGGILTVKEGRKEEAPCWSPAIFKGNRRAKHNALEIDLLVLDSDAGHTLTELAERVHANGWAAVIGSTSSHMVSRTTIQASAYDKWKEGLEGEDASLEAFLIDKKHMLPRVAAGAKEIRRFSDKKRKGTAEVEIEMIEIEHQPCPKFRVVLPLAHPWRVEDYPDPETARRAWEKAYMAVAEKLGLPFDETCRGVDRMFFFSRVSADRLPLAEGCAIEGADCPALDLSLSEKAANSDDASSSDRPAQHRSSHKREHREHEQRTFKSRVITDRISGKTYDGLKEWAQEIGPHFQLASALLDRGEAAIDERGLVNGKLHIECPFEAEHTSSANGGTFVVNARDRDKAHLDDLAAGFVIHCSHNACDGRDRLEFVEEMLETGMLTEADLTDWQFIIPSTGATRHGLLKELRRWTREQIQQRVETLQEFRHSDPEVFKAASAHWDMFDVIYTDELNRLLGGDDNSNPAATDIFERYVYVEEIKRFFDLTTREMLDKEQFRDRHADVGSPTNQKINAYVTYMTNVERRRLVKRPTYQPGEGLILEEDGDKVVNTWQPSSLVPIEGDVTPFLRHAAYLFPDPAEREILFDWMAYALQHPGEKCNWAPLIGGEEGIGKDTAFKPVIAGLGAHNVSNVRPGDLTGHWTDFLERKLVVVEEMMNFSKKEIINALKPLIAAPPYYVRVNTKNVPQYDIPNINAWLFFTNHEDALSIDDGDRRWGVFWSPAKPKPEAYYKALHDWLDKGGNAHVVAWLLRRDISRFNPKGHAPDTKAKRDMIAVNRQPAEAWIMEQIQDQSGVFRRDLLTGLEVVRYAEGHAPKALQNMFTPHRVAKALKKAGGAELGQVRVDGERPHVWAVRRKEMYEGLDEAKLRALYLKQRTDAEQTGEGYEGTIFAAAS
jgi:hypothetical protein